MSKPSGAGANATIVLLMLAMIAVPAGLSLHTVKTAATLSVADANPTPYGYTVSLLLFIAPIVVIGCWLLPGENLSLPRRAFWWTIGILVPFGFGLDFFCATRFFYFKNSLATLGIPAPALGGSVPLEEYVFYFTGFIAILLIYVWSDEYWLAAYNVPDYPVEARNLKRLFAFHPQSLAVGVVLIGAAVLYKRFVAPTHDGFPSYFTVLVALGLIPSLGLFPTARGFINWRAFSLTIFMVLLISIFWEATLAIPYGWWGYQEKAMMGLSIGAWAGLPIEAVIVWIAVTYATVMVFEVVKIWKSSGRSARDAFVGPKPPAPALIQGHTAGR